MEDAVDIQPALINEPFTEAYAVYDGHGGIGAVEFVRARLVNFVRSHAGFVNSAGLMDVLVDSFHQVDREVICQLCIASGMLPSLPAEMARVDELVKQDAASDIVTDIPQSGYVPLLPSLGRCSSVVKVSTGAYQLSSGCVTCLALLRDRVLYVAHLGDCRAVLCHAGEIEQLTEDHLPSRPSERQRLDKVGVEVSSDGYLHGRICVSRAFGDWAWDEQEKCQGVTCEPDVHKIELAEDAEFLLLACDGIFEKMSSKQAGQLVRRRLRATGSPQMAAEALVKQAKADGAQDNLSAIVRVFKLPPQASERTAPRLFGSPAINR